MGSIVGDNSENLRRSPLEVALYIPTPMQTIQGYILLKALENILHSLYFTGVATATAQILQQDLYQVDSNAGC